MEGSVLQFFWIWLKHLTLCYILYCWINWRDVDLEESILCCGVAVWAGAYDMHMNKLFVLQKKIIRTILIADRLFPSAEVFDIFNVSTIEQLYIKSLFREMEVDPEQVINVLLKAKDPENWISFSENSYKAFTTIFTMLKFSGNMSETEVCLKWNTFQECILSSFGLLWQEDQLTDVTITAGDNAIHAHKVILSACSPFFKKIFQETSCRHPTIILPGADINDLRKILAFIYKGEVFIEQERLSPFLRLAEELQIRGLWKPNERQEIEEAALHDKDHEQPTGRIDKIEGEPPSKRTKRKSHPGFGSNSFQAETSRPIRLEEIKQEDTTENNFRSSMDNPFENYALLTSKWMRNEDPNEVHHPEVTSRDIEHFPYLRLPYSDLLPSTEHLQVWARNRSLDQFACDLMKLLFTKDERIVCNVNGKMGKLQFNPHKINLIKEVLQFYSRIPESAFEEQWKVCVTKIDTANRGLKRRFKCKDIFNNYDRSLL